MRKTKIDCIKYTILFNHYLKEKNKNIGYFVTKYLKYTWKIDSPTDSYYASNQGRIRNDRAERSDRCAFSLARIHRNLDTFISLFMTSCYGRGRMRDHTCRVGDKRC